MPLHVHCSQLSDDKCTAARAISKNLFQTQVSVNLSQFHATKFNSGFNLLHNLYVYYSIVHMCSNPYLLFKTLLCHNSD